MNTESSEVSAVAGIALALGILAAYIGLGVFISRLVWGSSKALRRRSRIALTALVAACFFAPGLVPAGAGVGPVPAWLMLLFGVTHSDLQNLSLKALVSMAITWTAFFMIGLLPASNVASGSDGQEKRTE